MHIYLQMSTAPSVCPSVEVSSLEWRRITMSGVGRTTPGDQWGDQGTWSVVGRGGDITRSVWTEEGRSPGIVNYWEKDLVHPIRALTQDEPVQSRTQRRSLSKKTGETEMYRRGTQEKLKRFVVVWKSFPGLIYEVRNTPWFSGIMYNRTNKCWEIFTFF